MTTSEFQAQVLTALNPEMRLDSLSPAQMEGQFEAAVLNMLWRQDAVEPRPDWVIEGQVLTPAQYQELSQIYDEDLETLLEEWAVEAPGSFKTLPTAAVAEEQPEANQTAAGLAALAILGLAWIWSRETQTYTSTQNGSELPQETIESLLEAQIQATNTELQDLAQELQSGDITLEEFQQDAAIKLKRLGAKAGAIAFGGLSEFDKAAIQATQRAISEHLDLFRGFIQEVSQGTQSPAMLSLRLRRYAQGARIIYSTAREASHKAAGFRFEQRFLDSGPDVEHCDPCIEYASRGRVPIGTTPPIGVKCDCYDNDRCRKQYFR